LLRVSLTDKNSMDFELLIRKFPWRPIPNCPGRYSLAMETFSGPPAELAPGEDAREYCVDGARDPVTVVGFSGGGLISYRKWDGRYLHTLNTAEGLARKLGELGIPVDGS
jgi:hypothetical protein